MTNLTYQKCKEFLDKGRTKDSRLSRELENNTWLESHFDNGVEYFTVRYRATGILTFQKNGEIIVNNGGLDSVSTIQRIDTYAPVEVQAFSRFGSTIIQCCNESLVLDAPITIRKRGGVLRMVKTFKRAGGRLKHQTYGDFLIEQTKQRNERNRPRNRMRYWINVAQEEKKHTLTIDKIMAEENASVRVCMIQAYGVGKFLTDIKADVIDSLHGTPGGDYELLSYSTGEGFEQRMVRALKMACPSTGDTHIISVEPSTFTVPAALDWIFGTTDYLGRVVAQS